MKPDSSDSDSNAKFPPLVAEGEVPSIVVDPILEKSALRKFDKFLVPTAFAFLVLASLDRNNLGNANVFGFSDDLGLTGRMFGNLTTLLSATMILFEIPWVLLVSRFGANRVLGVCLVCWSCITLGTAFVRTYNQAIAVRILLGVCEAGVSPSFAFLFSTIYPPRSAGKRVMMTNLANCTSGAFGGLFAYAVQSMGTRKGIAPWRWLFIVEGAVTLVVGGVGLFMLPGEKPEEAWFLSEGEREAMRMKKMRDVVFRGGGEDYDNEMGDGSGRKKKKTILRFDTKWIKMTLKDPFIYIASLAFFTSSVAITGFGVFLPTILKGLGFASLQVNYMTIPVYVVGAISLVTNCYFSDKYQKRAVFLVGCCVPVILGYVLCVASPNGYVGYAGMFILALGIYPISTLSVAWVGTNLLPDAKRAFALPFYYSMANLSMLVSSQLYPADDGPRYVVGNSVCAGLEFVAGCLYLSVFLLLRHRNNKKKRQLAEGATTNGYQGDRGLDFMYGL